MSPKLRWLFVGAGIVICGTVAWTFVVGSAHSARKTSLSANVASHNEAGQGQTGSPTAGGGPISPAASPRSAAALSPSAPAVAPAPTASPGFSGKVVIDEGSGGRSFAIALDELVVRDASGAEQSLRVPAQADVAALRGTLRTLPVRPGQEVFLVAYEEGSVRSTGTRRLVTSGIRIALAPGAEVPAIPGAVAVERPGYAPGYAVVRMPDGFAALDTLAVVRSAPGVRQADVLLARQQVRRTLPNDSLISSQWHLKNTGQSGGVVGTDIDVEPVWNYGGSGYRGAGIVVGVVDDGLETAHPDLAANVRTDIDHDWNDTTPDDPNPGTDDDHGTACAGNVAAVGNNALGVSGSAPEAKVAGLRLIAASTTDSQEAEAMAYDDDIISIKTNSWGPADDGITLEGPGALTKSALQTAAQSGRGGLGTIILWAGGNGLANGDNSNYDGYANSIYSIAIGALTNKRNQAYYSESGANLVVVAPSSGDGSIGELGITTVDRSGSLGYNTSSGTAGNYTSTFGGTSSATPTAAGVTVLMLQRNPALGWRDVQEILIKTAVKVNPTDADWVTNSAGYHFNHKFGAGLVDANAAVTAAASWTNLAAQTSVVSTQSGLSVAIPNNNATGVTRTFDLGSSNLRVEQVTVRLTISHTARGNLAITLTSPSGIASRLAEVHGDTGDNYSNWTFMTVHDWGENSAGTWTLKIADLSDNGNTTGGTLSSAELVVFGSAAAPVNPAPVVQLTSPSNGASFSIGASIPLAATASDATITGAVGVISKVEFFSGAAVVATVTAPPYSANWTPPTVGSYTLSARATDSEGKAGVSGSVAVTVANLPPAVTAAAISPSLQAFADQALVLGGVSTADPEGTAVSLAYQWQSSSNGVDFSNVAGERSATLAASTANAGKMWRCVLTPSDGVNTGAAFTTVAVMVLTRPSTTVTAGQAYSYQSDLVLRGTATVFTREAIINEFSQGSTGTSEWVEILTLRAGSFRQWVFDDSSSGAVKVTFADSAVWDNIPAGTRIVIYNGGTAKDSRLPVDDTDPSDGKLVLSSANSAYFSGSWPGLGNSGDALVLKDASGAVVHQICYGNNTAFAPNIGSVGGGLAACFTGDTEAAAATQSGWRVNSSTTTGSATVAGVTPGEGNTEANIAFASNLHSGLFSQPALFRFGSGAQIPSGLSLNASTGLLSGTVTDAPGNYQIVIERYNGLGETVSVTFTLAVAAATVDFASWMESYPGLTDTSPEGDSDHDGKSNLLEYFLALDPSVADGPSAVVAAQSGSDLVLRYRRGKTVTGVTEQVLWSEDLVNWSTTGIGFDADQDLGTYVGRTARKAMGTSRGMFLRLDVRQTP